MPRLNLKQIVAAMPTAQTIVLPGDWFERLPEDVSVFESLYRWLIQSRSVESTRLHNRTYVGAALAKRLREAERQRIRKRRNLRGEHLENALNMSDLDSGPRTLFGDLEVTGDALFVIHSEDEFAAEEIAAQLSAEYREQKNRELRQISSGANFAEWLTSNSERDDVVGDLARDVLRDPGFPLTARHYQEIHTYLQTNGAHGEVLDALKDAWLEYSGRYRDRVTRTAWCITCDHQIPDFLEGCLIVTGDGTLECCHRACIDDPSSPTLPLEEFLKADWVNALIDFAEQHDVPNSHVAESERLFRLWGFGLEDNAARSIIYFIQAGTAGPIKIGYSGGHASRRLASLQTGSSEPLRLLAEIEGSRDTEAELHRRFAAYRKKGEWFEPHPELIAYISVLLLGGEN